MKLAESNQFHLYIDSVRDDIAECSQQLQEKQLAIANALKQSEELTIDAATLKVRMKELEFDEELLKQSEDAAIKEKVLAEKKLMEVGGFERAVRMLQRALREAKQELQDTKNEKVHIMSEEKKLHQELVQLNMVLHKSCVASMKLQQEYDTAMKNKREADEKLERLSMFLQKTIETAAGQSPTKSQQQQLEQKESFLSPPSPLPSPSSIRSHLSAWRSSPKSSSAASSSPQPSPTKSN